MSDANNIPDAPLSMELEENLRLHVIGAEIFAPFVIERFGAGSGVVSTELAVTITDENGQVQTRSIHLTWQAQSASAKPLAVQEWVRTEWGALGVACALLPTLLRLRVLSVALEGERFDYRIGDDTGEWGLEVSGTLLESAEDLRERHRLKIRQHCENPPGLSGYVVMVGFTLREVLISFHLPDTE